MQIRHPAWIRVGRKAAAIALAWSSMAMGQASVSEAPPCLQVIAQTPEDCGLTPVGDEVSRVFRVTNTQQEPVSIRLLNKTCGCVSAEINPSELRPGESAEVRLSTPSAPLGGEQYHTASFEVSAQAGTGQWKRICTFAASFRYTPEMEFQVFPPNRLLAHAVAGRSKDVVIYVNADHARNRPPRHLQASIPEIVPVGVEEVPENVNVVKLRFRVRPTAVGVLSGTVGFETDSRRFPKVVLPITVVVQPEVLVNPPGFIVDRSHLGSGSRFTCTIAARHESGSLPRGLRTLSEKGHFEAQIEQVKGGSAQLVVTASGKLPASGSDQVWILDDSGNKLAAVPLAWTER